MQDKWRELAQRWNALAPELELDSVAGDPAGGVAACAQYAVYKRVKALVAEEAVLVQHATRVFPDWTGAYRIDQDAAALAELERMLVQHRATRRLAQVWGVKERHAAGAGRRRAGR